MLLAWLPPDRKETDLLVVQNARDVKDVLWTSAAFLQGMRLARKFSAEINRTLSPGLFSGSGEGPLGEAVQRNRWFIFPGRGEGSCLRCEGTAASLTK